MASPVVQSALANPPPLLLQMDPYGLHGDIDTYFNYLQLSVDSYVKPFSLHIILKSLNVVALVGYDQVTVLESNPNITEYDQWWAPKFLPSALRFRTKPGECQETNLPIGVPLRTNSSLPLFTYTITNNIKQQDAVKDSQGRFKKETPYKANPLATCHVQNMTLTMEPKILSFAVATTLLCDLTGDPPRLRRFQTTFKRTNTPQFRSDSILDYMAYMAMPNDSDSTAYKRLSQDGPKRDSLNNALGVVDVLGSDLIRAMLMRKISYNLTNHGNVPELGSFIWDSKLDSRSPTNYSRILKTVTYRDGYWIRDGDYLLSMNMTIINFFVALRDAIHLDVGNLIVPNIYTDKTVFNNMITVDPFYSKLAETINKDFHGLVTESSTPSWGWGYTSNVNVSWAMALRSTDEPVNNITLPIIILSPPAPSVIDMMYLCPQYQIKSWGSLIVSVFTGTFTMYATLYGIFTWLAPAIDRKRRGIHPWEKHLRQKPLGFRYDQLANSSPTQSSSFSLPYYIKDAEEGKKWLLSEQKTRSE
ncbi:hypothetical protein RhiJN_26786 [Ceratobasidium sp. AG-Ba]|nr:hypothetical protein RhiJN_12736 [Ceratobasidium sp. AG-Ba]QRV98767.1 hypothetical protein RhiJN_26786 [Ceratobasidium sp. AG-Ba]